MPWQEVSIMSQRQEFVRLAMSGSVNFRELCRRFGISPPTGYKWLGRYREGDGDLSDRSRRPHNCPHKTSESVENLVLGMRSKHKTWGGRKIVARLKAKGNANLPAPSTVTEILRRHNLLEEAPGQNQGPWEHFEYEHPNDLWQMDFKGHFPIDGGRCHPLTILDDHSRFNIGLRACLNEKGDTVRGHLTDCFRRYGLPKRMLMDNGAPWSGHQGLSALEAWLMRLSIHVMHGRPMHPQTQGKDERFHRTLKADVLQFNRPTHFTGCQPVFDAFRHVYNQERPHEALGLQTPASRYEPSSRSFPEALPPIEYAPGDQVRKAYSPGLICFKGRTILVGAGVISEMVAVRPTLEDGVWDVIYCTTKIRQIDLRQPAEQP